MLRAARCFQCDRETRTKSLGKRHSHKDWANAQMCSENGICHHYFNSLSLPPTIPQFTLLVICESQDAWHCIPWHSPASNWNSLSQNNPDSGFTTVCLLGCFHHPNQHSRKEWINAMATSKTCWTLIARRDILRISKIIIKNSWTNTIIHLLDVLEL